jgi:hypothetical protein
MHRPDAMNHCAVCGQELVGEVGLCPYHYGVEADGWSSVNRIMCDLIHRGIVPPRLSREERERELAGHALDAA